MTDNEIIKALECCLDCNCKECPCCRIIDGGTHCTEIDEEQILDLINRQKAEIKRLQKQLGAAEYCIREIDVALYHGSFNDYCGELIEKYNNLVKTMTGI